MKINLAAINSNKVEYKILINSNENVNLTVYQNYGLSLLTQDTEVLIEGTNDYVFYP
jgi:hypothetical protein